jgi:hypothetical protein
MCWFIIRKSNADLFSEQGPQNVDSVFYDSLSWKSHPSMLSDIFLMIVTMMVLKSNQTVQIQQNNIQKK